MTTLDNSKLHRILTMADCYTVELATSKVFMQAAQALWRAAQVEQREEDARIVYTTPLPNRPHEIRGPLVAAIRNSGGVK